MNGNKPPTDPQWSERMAPIFAYLPVFLAPAFIRAIVPKSPVHWNGVLLYFAVAAIIGYQCRKDQNMWNAMSFWVCFGGLCFLFGFFAYTTGD